MTLEKLPLEGMTVKDPIVLKVNEIIDYINSVEEAFGIDIGTQENLVKHDNCCKDDPVPPQDEYKENQLKGNEV